MDRRTFVLGSLATLSVPALAGEPGTWTALVVMKRADCPVCLAEIAALVDVSRQIAELRPVAVTHDDDAAASAAASRTGVLVTSDPDRIRALGLFDAARGQPRPAVVLFDPCGREVGRILGRGPGYLAAPAVVELWRRVPRTACAGPLAT